MSVLSKKSPIFAAFALVQMSRGSTTISQLKLSKDPEALRERSVGVQVLEEHTVAVPGVGIDERVEALQDGDEIFMGSSHAEGDEIFMGSSHAEGDEIFMGSSHADDVDVADDEGQADGDIDDAGQAEEEAIQTPGPGGVWDNLFECYERLKLVENQNYEETLDLDTQNYDENTDTTLAIRERVNSQRELMRNFWQELANQDQDDESMDKDGSHQLMRRDEESFQQNSDRIGKVVKAMPGLINLVYKANLEEDEDFQRLVNGSWGLIQLYDGVYSNNIPDSIEEDQKEIAKTIEECLKKGGATKKGKMQLFLKGVGF